MKVSDFDILAEKLSDDLTAEKFGRWDDAYRDQLTKHLPFGMGERSKGRIETRQTAKKIYRDWKRYSGQQDDLPATQANLITFVKHVYKIDVPAEEVFGAAAAAADTPEVPGEPQKPAALTNDPKTGDDDGGGETPRLGGPKTGDDKGGGGARSLDGPKGNGGGGILGPQNDDKSNDGNGNDDNAKALFVDTAKKPVFPGSHVTVWNRARYTLRSYDASNKIATVAVAGSNAQRSYRIPDASTPAKNFHYISGGSGDELFKDANGKPVLSGAQVDVTVPFNGTVESYDAAAKTVTILWTRGKLRKEHHLAKMLELGLLVTKDPTIHLRDESGGEEPSGKPQEVPQEDPQATTEQPPQAPPAATPKQASSDPAKGRQNALFADKKGQEVRVSDRIVLKTSEGDERGQIVGYNPKNGMVQVKWDKSGTSPHELNLLKTLAVKESRAYRSELVEAYNPDELLAGQELGTNLLKIARYLIRNDHVTIPKKRAWIKGTFSGNKKNSDQSQRSKTIGVDNRNGQQRSSAAEPSYASTREQMRRDAQAVPREVLRVARSAANAEQLANTLTTQRSPELTAAMAKIYADYVMQMRNKGYL